MRTHEELVAEANRADVTGWGFGWLDGRATEERPPTSAIVWILHKSVWVPDFTVERHDETLRELDAGLRAGEPFVAHSTRHLTEARLGA